MPNPSKEKQSKVGGMHTLLYGWLFGTEISILHLYNNMAMTNSNDSSYHMVKIYHTPHTYLSWQLASYKLKRSRKLAIRSPQ
jgi:hypothetical protein